MTVTEAGVALIATGAAGTAAAVAAVAGVGTAAAAAVATGAGIAAVAAAVIGAGTAAAAVTGAVTGATAAAALTARPQCARTAAAAPIRLPVGRRSAAHAAPPGPGRTRTCGCCFLSGHMAASQHAVWNDTHCFLSQGLRAEHWAMLTGKHVLLLRWLISMKGTRPHTVRLLGLALPDDNDASPTFLGVHSGG